MPTAELINAYSNEIFTTARSGTNKNPKGLPVNLANLLVAQAKHETGNFTSNIFRTGNNAFGYSYDPRSIHQIGQGVIADNKVPSAKYASIANSTAEIVDWIYRRINEGKFPVNLDLIQTPDEYALLLKNAGYYQDTLENYLNGLKRFFTQHKTTGVFLVIGVGFALWALSYPKAVKKLFKK